MKVEILGSVQDGGVPHLGCNCDTCSVARADRNKTRYASSIKVYDEEKEVNYLFDASADIRHQIGDEYLDGIFLSHAHLGHILGLLFLGRESINANMVPVYCSPNVEDYLENNTDYRLLIDRNNIHVNTFEEGDEIELMGLTVKPVEALHRYVPTDMHAFIIESDDRSLLYLSDLDQWTDAALRRVKEVDLAIIDGCFWSEEEIDRYERVPHIPVTESIEKLKDIDTEIYFIHMNHTNPILDPDSPEREQVEEAGMHVAEEGMELQL